MTFSLKILDIELSESTETFVVKVSYTRVWYDRRLKYRHLKRESGVEMNSLLTEELNSIWYPYVIFENMKSIPSDRNNDVSDTYWVVPNENYTHVAHNNMYIFKGSENALNLTKKYYIEWKCEYAYQWYPFDTQVCRMEMISRQDDTELHPVNLFHNPKISFNSYTLKKIQMCRSILLDKEAIVTEVTMVRLIMNNLLTVFVPTTLLVVISFAARAFAEDYLDMVIQVNLTILVILATM